MDVVDVAPEVTSDGREVVFRLSSSRDDVACSIDRDVLEEHFWLPAGAGKGRVLKAFSDGRSRIIAAAERRARLRPGETIRLSADDFVIKS